MIDYEGFELFNFFVKQFLYVSIVLVAPLLVIMLFSRS